MYFLGGIIIQYGEPPPQQTWPADVDVSHLQSQLFANALACNLYLLVCIMET